MKFSPLPCYLVSLGPNILHILFSNLISPFRWLGHTKVLVQVRGFVCEYLVTKIRFRGEEVLTPRPTPKLENHPLSAVCDCLFNTFAATLHTGGRSSIRNLRTYNALVTGTNLSYGFEMIGVINRMWVFIMQSCLNID
jgi:hypothetical protein